MERVGFLGGSFDPPHMGHLWLGELARQQLALDVVLFIPAGQPPHKKDEKLTPAHHRLAMTELAIQNNPHFHLNDSDIARPGPHFTVDLVPLLHRSYPGADFWLLAGTDSLRDLPNWHEPQRLLELCRLAILPRDDAPVNFNRLAQALPGLDSVLDMLDGPTIMLSSTWIRRWASAGHSLRYLVPAKVAEYISRHRIYLRRAGM
jgi:nicotinate-nucleotide adenylyltransferase